MTTYFSSDLHFGHKNIILFTGRPYRDVTHMNEMLVHNLNEAVGYDDTLYLLGDIAMGSLEDSLNYVRRIVCNNIYLISGNHDRTWSHWKHKTEEKRQAARMQYEAAGLTILPDILETELFGRTVTLSHLPYDGDSQEDDRYSEYRPIDIGLPLLHGHTHNQDKAHGNQFHVGVDAHFYKPVHEDTIKEWLDEL
jgi:calcineurin-like phosphoesterase family protein